MEPDNIYHVTDNRDYLNWSVLKNYDVLTICGCSPLYYKDEELRAIKRFVKVGGGLLLASSTSIFEKATGRAISEMHTNKLARLFRAEFLPLNRCKGKTTSGDHRGYPREDLCIIHHPALAELELDDIPISNCGIIAIPENAEVFLKHGETQEPVGACIQFGKGRVLLFNDLEFSHRSQRTCRVFIDWLAYNRMSKLEGDENIPDEIPVDEHLKEDGNITIYYTNFTEDRVDKCLEFVQKLDKELFSMFTDGSDIPWEIELIPSFAHKNRWDHKVGAFVSEPRLAYELGVEMMYQKGMSLWYEVFGYDTMEKCFGMMAMKILGFESEAESTYAEIVRQFREKDPTGKEFDITEDYEYHPRHPKSVWVLNTLIEKYGRNIFACHLERKMPVHLFSALDILVYNLSLALEIDLYPWFEELGVTVHPLPLHPRDSDEFKENLRRYLKDMIGDKAASASDRNDAVRCLIHMDNRKNKPLSGSADGLDSDDKYERLVAATRLLRTSDARAEQILKDLAFDDDDRTLAAMASLALVQRGKASAAERLFETAREQDYRFQIDAGYVLNKVGYEKAKELSFKGLKDEKGGHIVKMKVEYDGDLKLFPMVEERKVGNIFLKPAVRHLPENTHVTMLYVDQVHTDSRYRRKGLSSWTMKEAMLHKAVRRCSCAYLATGKRNVAHAMYRSFGFVDVTPSESFTKELQKEKAKVVEGLVIRSYSPGDEVKMASLANECYSDVLNGKRVRAKRPRLSKTYIKIAEKDGEMLGCVNASVDRSRGNAHIGDICLKKTDERHDIGSAVLCALHNELVTNGFKEITISCLGERAELDFLRKLLSNFGYSSQRTGGIGMFKIINLPMLLSELSPLLSKRLQNSDYKEWQVIIGIAGNQHKASIIIEKGEIGVSEEVLGDANILLSGDDDTITRIIAGMKTPYEAYLQTELSIRPMVDDKELGLLETIFPRIPK